MSKTFHLKKEEYQCILDLCQNTSDYALVFDRDEQCYLLFVHGSKDGYVVINHQICTLQMIGKFLETQNIKTCLKVVCCYGAYQSSYITDNLCVTSYTQNKEIMNLMLFIKIMSVIAILIVFLIKTYELRHINCIILLF